MPPPTTRWKTLCVCAVLNAVTLSVPATADFSIPGFELVHSLPVATDLNALDVRDPATVWCEMIDGARKTIDLEQFYATSMLGTALDRVITRLEAAGARGVHIRFLMEKKGERMSDAETLARLKRIPNLEFRELAYSDISGDGIIHAKFFVVDGRSAFVGSQNFDWRALEHIDETGLKIDQPAMVAQLMQIFAHDWNAQALIADGKTVPRLKNAFTPALLDGPVTLLASPAADDPEGVVDSEQALVSLIGQARHSVRVTVMDYAPIGQHRLYYDTIDRTLRAAASRGVKIELIVANWCLTKDKLPYLKSLAVLPNIEIRAVTIPQAPTGFIPFARVVHTKTMTIDGKIAWIGTSNWEGGYLDNSRNIEIVLRNAAMAEKLNALHQQLWLSTYATPLRIDAGYPPPHPGQP
jgi:phosphatidylserine/phosphatidylglycerophosphate/cardiolipin synthase-like enzyme